MRSSDVRTLRRRLLAWFRRHRRRLPWRRSPLSARGRRAHAYRVWVSEIMLQQTRVAAVVPYYERFLRRFPTVRSLARAKTDDVLRHWAGLGYYHRARNLHRAAREIVRRHAGCFPADHQEALALPGIGRYTAAAILSIAYGQPFAVLDGNVARVLARLECLRCDSQTTAYRRKLEALAAELLPQAAPGDFNQAMMELGATVCRPRQPLCERCPLERLCRARRAGLERIVPTRRRKRARVAVELGVAVAERAGRLYVVRDSQRFFSRLWQFPSGPLVARDTTLESARRILQAHGLRPREAAQIGRIEHGVTHHDVRLNVVRARVDGDARRISARARWVRPRELAELPISSATRKVFALWRARRELRTRGIPGGSTVLE